jgi:hypothetical protein
VAAAMRVIAGFIPIALCGLVIGALASTVKHAPIQSAPG